MGAPWAGGGGCGGTLGWVKVGTWGYPGLGGGGGGMWGHPGLGRGWDSGVPCVG